MNWHNSTDILARKASYPCFDKEGKLSLSRKARKARKASYPCQNCPRKASIDCDCNAALNISISAQKLLPRNEAQPSEGLASLCIMGNNKRPLKLLEHHGSMQPMSSRGPPICPRYAERRKSCWCEFLSFGSRGARNLFRIALNQTEITSYLPFSDSFDTKRNSVWF